MWWNVNWQPLRLWGWFLAVILIWSILPGPHCAVAQEGQRLLYGERVEGRITAQEFRQVFYFEARRGDVISTRMTPSSGNLDPQMVLVDNAGHLLAQADDSDGSLGSLLSTVQIPEDNYYFIIASRYGQALGVTEGQFELTLERVGVLSVEGVYLSYGDSVVGVVDDDRPVVRYVFEAQRGDILTINMRRISGNLDSYLAVLNEKGQVIATNDDLSGSLDAAVDGLLVLESGLYTLIASRFGEEAGDSRGSFVLSLDTAPTSGQGLSPDSALLLRYGQQVEGDLGADAPARYYTFGAARGDIVTISMDRASGTLDSYLVLADERGIQLAEDDDSGPSNNALIQSFIIPESGTYLLEAARFDRAAGTTAGEYILRIEGITGEAPVVEPGTLTILYGGSISGEITDSLYLETYAFLGNAGDVITIDMTSASDTLDPYLLLFSSASVQLAEDDDSGPGKNARIALFTLPSDDIYYIVATRYEYEGGDSEGAYSLSLSRVAP